MVTRVHGFEGTSCSPQRIRRPNSGPAMPVRLFTSHPEVTNAIRILDR